jgi:hypothetical protein
LKFIDESIRHATQGIPAKDARPGPGWGELGFKLERKLKFEVLAEDEWQARLNEMIS